jgi:hypothetical protein
LLVLNAIQKETIDGNEKSLLFFKSSKKISAYVAKIFATYLSAHFVKSEFLNRF